MLHLAEMVLLVVWSLGLAHAVLYLVRDRQHRRFRVIITASGLASVLGLCLVAFGRNTGLRWSGAALMLLMIGVRFYATSSPSLAEPREDIT